MERTKYTPKRLLSLLLALIMLLGMFPTAALAEEAELPRVQGIDVQSGDNGWRFIATPEIPEQEYYLYNTYVDVPIHYTFSTDDTRLFSVKSLTLKVWAGDETEAPAEAQVDLSNLTPSAEQGTTVTLNGAPKTAYQKNTVIASGTFTVSGYIDENGTISFTGDFRFYTTGMCQNDDGSIEERTSYDTKYDAHQNSEITIQGLPLGYQVHYESSLSGAKGIPTGTYYSYRDEETDPDEEYFTVEAEAPTLDGYKFIGWAINGEDDSEKYVQQGAGFAPEQNTTLTAMWEKVEETQTHTVSFVADVTGVSQLPDAIIVEHDTVIPADTVTELKKAKPIREGYNFLHWTDNLTTKANYNFTQKITADVKLYPVWTRNQVRITWPTSTSAGETLIHPGYTEDANHSTMVDVGSTVTFRVQWHTEYDPATVLANDLPLGGRVGTEDQYGVTYTYQFTANEDTTITVNPATRKTFTITLPSANGCDVTFTECRGWDSRDMSAAEGSTSYTFQYGDKFKVKLDVFPDTRATLRVDGTAVLSNVDGNGSNHTQIAPDTTDSGYPVDHDYVITVNTRPVVTRTVIYSLEPYSGVYQVQYVQNGEKLNKPANPEIPGYEFVDKWTTKPNGGGSEWNFANDKVTSNLVLYGQLTALTYAVNYDANANGDATVSGIPAAAQTKTHGEPLTLSDSTPTRKGYTFKGWATSPDGPVAYMPGSQYLNDAPVTLYAVWEKLTYTVTISSDAGYSTVPAGVATVNWHDPFTFTVNVDRQYAATTPEVVDSEEGTLTAKTGEVNHTGATSYTYEIGENHKIEQNRTITITVTQNAVHQVSFKVSKVTPGANGTSSTVTEQAPFLIQSVEHGYYASMPAAPEREGYKFKGYYSDDLGTTEFPFNNSILKNETVYAVYEAIQPKITAVKVKDAANGWELKNWKYGKQDPLTAADPATTNPFTIAYGDDVTFDLVIQPGFDYSKLSVSANGYELGRESITTAGGVTTISFRLVYVTANTRITVSGIERKTITVTYNENALDHVSNLPAPQTANYYIDGDGNNTNFTDQVPIRNGYTFLGWSTDGSVTAEEFKNATEGPMTDANAKKYFKIDTIKNHGVEIPFTADTTVYAIWEAQESTVTLMTVLPLRRRTARRTPRSAMCRSRRSSSTTRRTASPTIAMPLLIRSARSRCSRSTRC